MNDRVAIMVSAAVAALHLAAADRYALFRDELYFIVCGRHPAFGYADQPPLVPLLAAGMYALGGHTWLVRLPAVLAAVALVWLAIAFARLLGGRDGAASIAGIAAGSAPVLMGLTATLNTTTFEPIAWTLVAYGIARAVILDDRRALLWSGAAAGIAMEAKYAMPLWLLCLLAGLALGPERRILARRELWLGVGAATVIAAPSVLWQAAHGFPFVELVRNAGDKDLPVAPLAFALNQIAILNPVLAPLWITGLLAPFVRRDLRQARFASTAFACAAAAIVAGHGKDYYLAPAYPLLFAIGAVALERVVRSAAGRMLYLALALAASGVAAPLALPLLPPSTLVAYEHTLHVGATPQESGDNGDLVPPTFADMLGWHDFVHQVGTAYAALPAGERERTAVLVDNYGEAAALDVYGMRYGLPPALSGHNQYYFWGTRGQRPVNVLRVQRNIEKLRPYCAQTTLLASTASPYARTFENGKAIAFCRGLHPAMPALWPSLRMLL